MIKINNFINNYAFQMENTRTAFCYEKRENDSINYGKPIPTNQIKEFWPKTH